MDIQNFLQNLTPWFLSGGVKIVFIILGAWIITRVARIFVSKIIKTSVEKGYKLKDGKAQERRKETLEGVFNSTVGAVVWIMAGLMVISEFGINIGPVLAGAGILGVAIGFGAQYMIRDFLAGLFIILEDQYRVGDVVCFDSTCGGVEEINLRRTVLRDLDGVQHIVPNGEIKKASNLSKGFARVNLNVGVAYKENLDKVIEILNKVGSELSRDSQWKADIIKVPQVLGVDDFADSAIIIKVLGDTKPLRQWDVARELRKRIKIAFDKEGIEIPFPQISVWPRGKF